MGGYRHGCYWFELCEMLRKFLLVSALVVISPDDYVQQVFALIVCMTYVWWYEYFKPVIDKPMEGEDADGHEGEGTIKSNRSEITNVFSNPVYRGGSAPQGDRESIESAPVMPNENGVLDVPLVDKAV